MGLTEMTRKLGMKHWQINREVHISQIGAETILALLAEGLQALKTGAPHIKPLSKFNMPDTDFRIFCQQIDNIVKPFLD